VIAGERHATREEPPVPRPCSCCGAADDAATFLEALRRIAKAADDEQWLRHLTAAELAQIHNALFDRTFLLLTAFGVLKSDVSPSLLPEPVDREVVMQIARRLRSDAAAV
jgi:hypothetical protein